jgi:DNA-binding IclR family transcriptional regulator
MLVKQAENVLSLLDFFADRRAPASLLDISRHFGWPRSSTFNLISTLAEHGFLYEVGGRKGVYPTSLWLELASAISEADPVPERLVRVVGILAERTGETVWLSIASGMARLTILVRESRQSVRVSARIGDRAPIQTAASGQALMSQMTDAEVERILRKADFHPYAENTPTSAEAVREQIALGRERGWFVSAGNFSSGLGGVAVPVVDNTRLFAVTVAGPLFRIESELPRFAELIYQAVADVYGPDHSRKTLTGMNTPG